MKKDKLKATIILILVNQYSFFNESSFLALFSIQKTGIFIIYIFKIAIYFLNIYIYFSSY